MTQIIIAIIGSNAFLWVLQVLVNRHYRKKDKSDLVKDTLSTLTYNRLADKIEHCLTKAFATPEERRELEKLKEIYDRWGWNGDMDTRLEKVYALPTIDKRKVIE